MEFIVKKIHQIIDEDLSYNDLIELIELIELNEGLNDEEQIITFFVKTIYNNNKWIIDQFFDDKDENEQRKEVFKMLTIEFSRVPITKLIIFDDIYDFIKLYEKEIILKRCEYEYEYGIGNYIYKYKYLLAGWDDCEVFFYTLVKKGYKDHCTLKNKNGKTLYSDVIYGSYIHAHSGKDYCVLYWHKNNEPFNDSRDVNCNEVYYPYYIMVEDYDICSGTTSCYTNPCSKTGIITKKKYETTYPNKIHPLDCPCYICIDVLNLH